MTVILEALNRAARRHEWIEAAGFGASCGLLAESVVLALNAVLAVAAPEMFSIRSLALGSAFSGFVAAAAFTMHFEDGRAAVGPLTVSLAAAYFLNPWLRADPWIAGAAVIAGVALVGTGSGSWTEGLLLSTMNGIGLVTGLYAGMAIVSVLRGFLNFFGLEVLISTGLAGWTVAVLGVASPMAVPLYVGYYAGSWQAVNG